MATLNTVFKNTFAEPLKEKGYVKVKGRQPYFARVVGGEIVQVITTRNYWCGEKDYKEFEILGGIASVYRKEVDLTLTPSHNINWLLCVSDYYKIMNRMNMDNEYRKTLMGFRYRKDDEESLYQAMKKALFKTEEHMLGVFDGVKDVESFMEYLDIFNPSRLNIDTYDEEKGEFVGNVESEGFLYIETDNHDDFIEEFEEKLNRRVKEMEAGLACWKSTTVEEEQRRLEEWRLDRVQSRDYIYNHPNIHEWVLKELEQRKVSNIERLRACGLEV